MKSGKEGIKGPLRTDGGGLMRGSKDEGEAERKGVMEGGVQFAWISKGRAMGVEEDTEEKDH